MTAPAFTILLPVHRPPALLPYAIASVLAQDRQDFELFVICDGAPPETASSAREFAATDARIRVFEHPKGERHGELYRHQALQEARGHYVCQIGDDDLWLPNHLHEVAALLLECDFGNLAQVDVLPDETLHLYPGDLADEAVRRRMSTSRFNFFGPTASAYRLSAYRALPTGWSPAPAEIWSDLFMWRKFLARDELRFGTRIVVSSLRFAQGPRRNWSPDRRRAEIAAWAQQVSKPGANAAVAQMALRQLSRTAYHQGLQVEHLSKTAKDAATETAEVNEKLRQVRAELRHVLRQSEKLSSKRNAMRQTLSWRLTRPFRKLARLAARSAGKA